MPDYTKGLIYKICCKDTSITECYIGSTTNLIKRRSQHKRLCELGKDLRVYNFIREHGGWDNWELVPIEETPFETKTQMHLRERFWKEELCASLNIHSPGSYAYYGSKEEAEKHWRLNLDMVRNRQTRKEWRDQNNERVKKTHKEWRDHNPEKIKNYQLKRKAIYNENKDVINERRRAIYLANKDKFNERRRELAAAKRAEAQSE